MSAEIALEHPRRLGNLDWLQWGRAPMSAEIARGLRRDRRSRQIAASMGPRSDERGNPADASQRAIVKHAVASMGPRSDERGNSSTDVRLRGRRQRRRASMGPRSDERGNRPLRTIEFSKNFGTLCERPSATGTVHRQALPRVVGKFNICKLFQASSGSPVFVVTSPLASLNAFRTRRTGALRPSASAPATWFESQGRADNLPCSRTRDASRACPFSARRRAKIPSSPLASD